MTTIDSKNKRSINQDQISHYQHKLQYEIDPWDLKKMLENDENVVVIDARTIEAYKTEHIPKSINFPHRTINPDSAVKILNFNTQYVAYCDGVGCNASTKCALKLAELGYQVKELIGGIEWWKRDGFITASSSNPESIERSPTNCGCD